MSTTRILLSLCLAVPLCACGGRVNLAENHGASFRRVVAAQGQSRPRKGPVGFNATDVRIVTANRKAVTTKQGAGSTGTTSTSTGGGGGGQPTAVTVDLGESNAASDGEGYEPGNPISNPDSPRRRIVLQAK